jgi:hypothetical protein
MVAAYDEMGRLKKNALLGTSLAVDPNRATQRQAFNDLYGEAKEAATQGMGREGFLSRLSSRYGDYERSQHQTLGELARQSQGFVSEAQKLRDFEKEDELRQRASKFRDMTSGLKGKDGKLEAAEFGQLKKSAPALVDEAQQKWKKMTPIEKAEQKVGKGVNQRRWIMDYVLGGEKRAMDEHAAYEANINQEVDRINSSLIPIQQEYADRQQRLADRVELYNLFLGA